MCVFDILCGTWRSAKAGRLICRPPGSGIAIHQGHLVTDQIGFPRAFDIDAATEELHTHEHMDTHTLILLGFES